MINYFPTSGDKHGWAIDEDLRLIRSALRGVARETTLAMAQVIHSPFWASLESHAPEVLAKRFVIAHADNPPFFYLTQPSFGKVQQVVNLWVARSTEAQQQFSQLNLPSVHIPYAIDEGVFHELPTKANLRAHYGLPSDAYIIGNFHRDSEGADLSVPKYQKSPEMLVQVCKRVLSHGAKIHVLLAGPRRHWIREALKNAGIPFTFIGQNIARDDFGINILPRHELNRLYNACDLYLIPSRWEGGPQSAMEAAACRTKILSVPLGVGRDILDSASLFDTASEAASRILDDIKNDSLSATLDPQFERWRAKHTSSSLSSGLRSLYTDLESNVSLKQNMGSQMTDGFRDVWYRLSRRLVRPESSPTLALLDEGGKRLKRVREELGFLGVSISNTAPCRIAGHVRNPMDWGHKVRFQFAEADFRPSDAIPGACLVFSSVQEAVNYRTMGGPNPVVVCPHTIASAETSERPFLVNQGDIHASDEIAKAMGAGRPIVYPDDSAYYYQVFHAGLSYGSRRSLQEALSQAEADGDDFRALAKPAASLRQFLGNLIK